MSQPAPAKPVAGVEDQHHLSTSPTTNMSENADVPPEAPPTEKDEVQHLSGSKLYTLVLALLLTVLIMTLDMSILATAIPKITDDFHTINDIGWYGATYLMCSSSLQPLSGRIYTYFPLKYSYLVFLGIFAFGSLICGTAVSSAMLIIGRSIAGVGGSGLANGAMTIIGIEGPPDKRPMLLGMLFALTGLGQLIGPLVGGALTEHASWRWCFYINLPATALTAASIMLIRFTGKQKRKTDWTWRALVDGLDLVGFVLFAPACVMLLLALQWGGVKHAWDSATIIGLICGSGAVAVLFVFWERRAGETAMVPPALITRRIIAASCLTGFFQGGGMVFLSYYLRKSPSSLGLNTAKFHLALWFQAVKGASPTTSAVHTLPTFISQLLFTIIGIFVVQRFLYLAPPAVVGNIVGTIGAALMTTFNIHTSSGKWIGYQILTGAGRGLGLQQPFLAVQSHCPPAQLAVGTAVVAWSQFFGGAIFVAMGQTAFANLLRHSLTQYAPDVDQEIIVEAGATNYAADVPASQQGEVLLAYNQAIVQTYYLAVASAAAAAITAVAMGAAKSKKKAKKTVKQDGVAMRDEKAEVQV